MSVDLPAKRNNVPPKLHIDWPQSLPDLNEYGAEGRNVAGDLGAGCGEVVRGGWAEVAIRGDGPVLNSHCRCAGEALCCTSGRLCQGDQRCGVRRLGQIYGELEILSRLFIDNDQAHTAGWILDGIGGDIEASGGDLSLTESALAGESEEEDSIVFGAYAKYGAGLVGDRAVAAQAAAVEVYARGAALSAAKEEVESPESRCGRIAHARCAATEEGVAFRETKWDADGLSAGAQQREAVHEFWVGRDEHGAGRGGGVSVAPIVVLAQKRDAIACDGLAKGDRPCGHVAPGSWAGNRDPWRLREDGRAKLAPQRLKC